MNPQLTISLAQSYRQDLERAARASRTAGLSTGSSLTARLRESVAGRWTSRGPARSSGTTPAVTGV